MRTRALMTLLRNSEQQLDIQAGASDSTGDGVERVLRERMKGNFDQRYYAALRSSERCLNA